MIKVYLAIFLLSISHNPRPTPGKQSKPEQQQSTPSNQQAEADQRGTDKSPLVVKEVPSPKTPEETNRDAYERKEKSANDRAVIWETAALALIGFLQLLVYGYQAKKLRQTVESAEGQSAAMERHISEASRSAQAMENVVKTIKSGNQAALRAYVTVVIGGAVFQELRDGLPNLKFEAKPLVLNTGNTPARKLCMRKEAAILPIPIPEDFDFPLPEEWVTDVGALGAHQNYTLSHTLDDFVPWDEVGIIKKADSKALCVWGILTYEDIFGDKHSTRFGQILNWQADGQTVYGHYIKGQNDAN